MKRSIVLSAIVFLTTLSGANAASYCWWSGGRLHDGQTVTETLRIVVSSVPREQIAGRSSNRPWCTQNRSSLGGHSSSKLIEKPRFGEVRLNSYRVSYKGDRIGKDRFVIERRWLNGNTNQWQSGRIIYEVDVVGQPF
jgi:hypothetical protein